MKKIITALCLFALGMSAQAQIIKPKNQDTYTLDANGQLVRKDDAAPRKALFERKKKEIPAKYLAGACPEVNGKVTWEKTIEANGLSAKEIYDRMLVYMQAFCKSKEQTELSNVSIVEESSHTIGARLQEIMVFQNKALSLDQTKFNYQLILQCSDGKCLVTMRNMSYIYEEDRGGGQFPAEDMLADANALNKRGDGFQKGGITKFRMHTIDRKDEIFTLLENALK